MALEQDASSLSKICMLVVGKEASTLSTLLGIVNCVKNGTTRKISSNRCQRLAAVLSVKFENLVPSIFRNENSSLEINVSHFPVDTQCRFNVDTMSYNVVRRRIDVEMTSCVYRVRGDALAAAAGPCIRPC